MTWHIRLVMSVCMYACMYVCMYVCIYIYIYIYVYICVLDPGFLNLWILTARVGRTMLVKKNTGAGSVPRKVCGIELVCVFCRGNNSSSTTCLIHDLFNINESYSTCWRSLTRRNTHTHTHTHTHTTAEVVLYNQL